MNWINRKIAFLFKRDESFVYGIMSHGLMVTKPTLIFRNGEEYFFEGRGEGAYFYYKKQSLIPSQKSKTNFFISTEVLESELIAALKRYGFHDVYFIE